MNQHRAAPFPVLADLSQDHAWQGSVWAPQIVVLNSVPAPAVWLFGLRQPCGSLPRAGRVRPDRPTVLGREGA
jgi:hypothetical protein